MRGVEFDVEWDSGVVIISARDSKVDEDGNRHVDVMVLSVSAAARLADNIHKAARKARRALDIELRRGVSGLTNDS